MAGADRVQIILEARNELSQEIRKAEKDLKSLKAQEAAMVKGVVEGNVLVRQSYDDVHDEVVQLEAAISRLREKRKILSAQERAEAKKSVSDEIEMREQTRRRELAIVSLTRRIDGLTNVVARQRRGWDLLSARIGRAAQKFKEDWTRAINSVERQIKSLHSKMGSLLTSRAARFGGMAAGLAGGALTMMGLRTASNLEQTQIAYETMLGSAAEAQKMMAWLQKTTMETPFELQGLTSATQRLLAFGFSADEARKNLITIGDAAAATGLQQEGIERVSLAIGQMQGKQKIQSQEMRQLTEAGIPAWEMLAEKMGMTVAELMALSESKGGGAEIFNMGGLSKLLEAMTDRYGGLMEKQVNTLGGRWSNLLDTLNLKSAAFLKETGLQEWLKGAMKNAAVWVGDAFDWLTEKVNQLKPIITDMVDRVRNVFKWIGDHKQLIMDIALAVGTFVIALYGLSAAATVVSGAIAFVNMALLTLSGNPVMLVIIGIAALAAALVLAYKKVDWFRNAVNAAWEWIQKAVAWFVDWFKTYAWPVIRGYLKFWWSYMKNVVWPVIKFVMKVIGVAFKILWAYISKVWWPAMRAVGRFFIKIWRAVAPAVKTMWDTVVAKFKVAKAVVMGIVNAIKDGFKGLWTGITEGLPDAINTIKGWLSRIPGVGSLIDFFAFAGGEVRAGETGVVGELGPELFIPTFGTPQMIGENGPEIRDFNASGVIIPNHLLAPAMAAQAAPVVVSAPQSSGVQIGEVHVHDRVDLHREFEAIMARQRRIAAERS